MVSNCKYCNKQIDWIQVNGKNKPVNLDNTAHSCINRGNNNNYNSNKPAQPQQQPQQAAADYTEILEKILVAVQAISAGGVEAQRKLSIMQSQLVDIKAELGNYKTIPQWVPKEPLEPKDPVIDRFKVTSESKQQA